MLDLIGRAELVYKKHGAVPPWIKTRGGQLPRQFRFIGVLFSPTPQDYRAIEKRVEALRSRCHSPEYNDNQRVDMVMQELLRSGIVDESQTHKARKVVVDWVDLVCSKKRVSLWEKWVRKAVPVFLDEKEPSAARKTFCFLIDNNFIPTERFQFRKELNTLLAYYRRYQADPLHGLRETEKGELSRIIEFFKFLQLGNKRVVQALHEAIQIGVEIDLEDCEFTMSERDRIGMELDDIRWRLIKVLRWTPTSDKESIALMKTFLGSPNWAERMYALGFLGKAAGRLYQSDCRRSTEIITYILDRRMEIIRDNPSVLVLEMVKALMGDWDVRQPHQRKYLYDCALCVQGLKSIAVDKNVEIEIRRQAVLGLRLFSEVGGGGKARRAIKSLSKSEDILCQEAALQALGQPMPPQGHAVIVCSPQELYQQLLSTIRQLLFYRGRLDPYTQLKDWEFIGMTLGRGTSLYEVAILDKRWFGIRKFAPTSPKLPSRRVIPAIERITSSLAWVLGMPTVSKIQLVEDEGDRDSYFSYAIGQRFPLPNSVYEQIVKIRQAEAKLFKVDGSMDLSEAMRNLLLQMYGERDMYSENMERDPKYGEVIRENRIGSTIAYLHGKGKEAMAWHKKCCSAFMNPAFFDQVKFFNWIVDNRDQYGYRNLLVTGRRRNEKGELYLIDFASCFGFLQRGDLDWRGHLERFYSNLQICTREAPEIFINNIKPVLINFLSLSESTIREIIGEIRYGELSSEEKDAILYLLLAEKEVLAEEFLRWEYVIG